MRSKGRMKHRLASSSVGAQSQRSRRLFKSWKRLYVKCSTAPWSDVISLQQQQGMLLGRHRCNDASGGSLNAGA